MRGARRLLGLKLATVAIASVATLALCESMLELGGARLLGSLLASRRHDDRSGIAPDATTLLCVGDSYTFGLYYRAEESYPARLEQLLRAGDALPAGAPRRFVVENAGIPAQNLAQIAARLPAQLARLHPRAVLVLGGFNDRWNFAADEGHGSASFFERLVLVRLARLAFEPPPESGTDARTRVAKVGTTELAVETTDGVDSIDIDKNGQILRNDDHQQLVATRLERIVGLVRDAGALPILLSYPSPEPIYEPVARACADVAARLQVPYIDLRAAFAAELENHAYDELLIQRDKHPTDRGYWRMGVLAATELAEQGLFAPSDDFRRALVAAPARDFAVPPLAERLHPATLERGDDHTLKLGGPPAAQFRLLLAGATEPPQNFGSLRLPLAGDATFTRNVADDRLEGTLGEDGTATITLTDDERRDARYAALVILHDLPIAAADLLVRDIAGPLALE